MPTPPGPVRLTIRTSGSAVRPCRYSSSRSRPTSLQQSQQALNQASKQLSSATGQAAGSNGQANSAAGQANSAAGQASAASIQAGAVGANAQQTVNKASKLAGCMAAAGTDTGKLQACTAKYGSS